MAQQPHYVSETQIVRRVVTAPRCRFIWSRHAREQMEERGITAQDVIAALTNGQVTLEEQKQDVLWRVDGRDVDGRRIEVVVAVYEEELKIKVVTAF